MARLEAAARGAGPSWTILRPGAFMTNDLSWAPAIRDRGAVFAPYPDVALPVIDPADIAAVAAAALLQDRHDAATYTLTGPSAISPRERARTLGDALGVDIELVELTREAAKAQMTAMTQSGTRAMRFAAEINHSPSERASGSMARAGCFGRGNG